MKTLDEMAAGCAPRRNGESRPRPSSAAMRAGLSRGCGGTATSSHRAVGAGRSAAPGVSRRGAGAARSRPAGATLEAGISACRGAADAGRADRPERLMLGLDDDRNSCTWRAIADFGGADPARPRRPAARLPIGRTQLSPAGRCDPKSTQGNSSRVAVGANRWRRARPVWVNSSPPPDRRRGLDSRSASRSRRASRRGSNRAARVRTW